MRHNNNSGNAVSGGVGFVGLLQLTFIVLKLCKVITWGWGIVLLPTIISAGIFVVILLAIVIAAFCRKY